MFVCLSVGLLTCLQKPRGKLHEIFFTFCVAMSLSSSDNSVMFSHNGTCGPESKTTLFNQQVCKVVAPGAGGSKFADSDCRLV